MTYDIRGIANYILDYCEERQRKLSNVEVIKIAYFVHEHYLISSGSRITEAKVEAWEFGPVFREIYHSFKEFGRAKIESRAKRFDFNSKEWVIAKINPDAVDASLINEAISKVMHLSPSQLIHLSHEPGGPWDVVYNHNGPTNCGMEITDELILECGSRRTFN